MPNDLSKALLKSLGIQRVSVIANSMGGMVGVRFARLYPQTVQKLVLENPLGLEDYSKDIPPQQNDNLLKLEMAISNFNKLSFCCGGMSLL